jgi:hypothetical protein
LGDKEGVEDGAAAEEAEAGESIGGSGGEGNAGDGDGEGDEGGVQEPAEVISFKEKFFVILKGGAFRNKGKGGGGELIAGAKGDGEDLGDGVDAEDGEEGEEGVGGEDVMDGSAKGGVGGHGVWRGL